MKQERVNEMANEIELIRIHTTQKHDQQIDFGVFAAVDDLSKSERQELLERLEQLAKRLRNNEYPFKKK